MCHLGVRQLMHSLSHSVFCPRWVSQVQGFVFPKLLTKKKRVSSILLRNLRFTRTNGRCRFFGNRKYKKCTAAYDVEISHDVNKREDADHVSLVFQGVTFNECNVKLVIISTNCDNV